MKFWKLVLIAFFIPTVGFSQMNKAAQASNLIIMEQHYRPLFLKVIWKDRAKPSISG